MNKTLKIVTKEGVTLVYSKEDLFDVLYGEYIDTQQYFISAEKSYFISKEYIEKINDFLGDDYSVLTNTTTDFILERKTGEEIKVKHISGQSWFLDDGESLVLENGQSFSNTSVYEVFFFVSDNKVATISKVLKDNNEVSIEDIRFYGDYQNYKII